MLLIKLLLSQDELFNIHGAEKSDMKIDKWGIFTVSTANFKKTNKTQEVDRNVKNE